MTAHIAAYGRLGADPVERQSQSGNTWATASLAVNLSSGDEDAAPQWFGLVAFGKTAETLCRHGKGDLVSLSGRLQINRWRQDDSEREQLQIIAETVISARSVRPGGGRRHDAPRGAE